jgi:deoxyribodipyrimidine photolyase-related protein
MDKGEPVGGKWNYDVENRKSFSGKGPGKLPSPPTFKPDKITQDVIKLVNKKFGSHPGKCEPFNWPVTREAALRALQSFIKDRLPQFGDYQDAMWTGEATLYHSLLSSSLNLKLLNPREVVEAAVDAFKKKRCSLATCEGFVRQIIGWREYVRGVYWMFMPEYINRNELGADQDLPKFYWTGETDMQCLKDTITQTLNLGYAHPHSTPDGDGVVCPSIGGSSQKSPRMVSLGLLGCGRVGGTSQHTGDVPVF